MGYEMNGYVGKILRLNLTDRKISIIHTQDYEKWGGGHGIGTAIFFDLVKDKKISGFDPSNVVTIMTSPLSGTLAPSASGRTELQGIGVQAYPFEWFTRSNFGGRFGGMLKSAGWDGIVIEGKADKPVWVDIRNELVEIKDAGSLWGLDTWETQKKIWNMVSGGNIDRDWKELAIKKGPPLRTTQRPAVLTMGPVGESLGRVAALIHDAGSAAGQGGFGGVWGSKNLKAISVIGSGSIGVADPGALVEARLWAKQNYAFNPHELNKEPGAFTFANNPGFNFPQQNTTLQSRPRGCMGCHICCRRTTEKGGNAAQCNEVFWYSFEDLKKHGKSTEVTPKAADLVQRAGINAQELKVGMTWLKALYKQGFMGPGKDIPTDLPFDKVGEMEFAEKLIRQIENREGIGADLHQGLARAAKNWGRLEKDLKSGNLLLQYWGYPQHYDARFSAEWGYGSILGDRDINEHDFTFPCFITPSVRAMGKQESYLSARELSEIIAEKCKPHCDPYMIDFSDKGIYSESMAKTVAWHRHYTRFWKQSIGYCDFAFADFVNPYRPDKKGLTPEGEPKFLNAVTGRNLSFEDGMAIGKKIWNLDRAIWVMQGRHRDQEVFPDYTYETKPGQTLLENRFTHTVPVYEKGEWKYKHMGDRKLDRKKFEAWKTIYYKLEGWDPSTGWPKKSTLESLGLSEAARELAKHIKGENPNRT